MDYDCTACGACCAWSADWPRLDEAERAAVEAGDPRVPPADLVEDGYMRWAGDRCAALDGELGRATGCRIYSRRPAVCRACQPGDRACHVARRRIGLPVVEPESSLEDALAGGAGRIRMGPRRR